MTLFKGTNMKNIAKISTLLLVSCIGFSNFALAETEEELDKEIRQLEQEFDQPIIKLHKVNRKKKKAQSRSHKSAKNKKSITAQKTSNISQRKPVPITPPQPTKLFTQKKSAQTPSIFNPQASHRKLAPEIKVPHRK